jgi:hypothetical protein
MHWNGMSIYLLRQKIIDKLIKKLINLPTGAAEVWKIWRLLNHATSLVTIDMNSSAHKQCVSAFGPYDFDPTAKIHYISPQ